MERWTEKTNMDMAWFQRAGEPTDNQTDDDGVIMEPYQEETPAPVPPKIHIVEDGQRPSTSKYMASAASVEKKGPPQKKAKWEQATDMECSDEESEDSGDAGYDKAYERYVADLSTQQQRLVDCFTNSFDQGAGILEEVLEENYRLKLKVKELTRENRRLVASQMDYEMEERHREDMRRMKEKFWEKKQKLLDVLMEEDDEDDDDDN